MASFPENISFLFPSKDGEPTPIAKEVGSSIIQEIDSVHDAIEFEESPDGCHRILWQAPKKVLEIEVSADGQIIRYSGLSIDNKTTLEGQSPRDDDFTFLGNWIDSNKED